MRLELLHDPDIAIRSLGYHGHSGDVRVGSSKFTQNPGCHVICFNGNRSRKVNVSIRECSVSDNTGAYNEHGTGLE